MKATSWGTKERNAKPLRFEVLYIVLAYLRWPDRRSLAPGENNDEVPSSPPKHNLTGQAKLYPMLSSSTRYETTWVCSLCWGTRIPPGCSVCRVHNDYFGAQALHYGADSRGLSALRSLCFQWGGNLPHLTTGAPSLEPGLPPRLRRRRACTSLRWSSGTKRKRHACLFARGQVRFECYLRRKKQLLWPIPKVPDGTRKRRPMEPSSPPPQAQGRLSGENHLPKNTAEPDYPERGNGWSRGEATVGRSGCDCVAGIDQAPRKSFQNHRPPRSAAVLVSKLFRRILRQPDRSQRHGSVLTSAIGFGPG